MRLGLPGPGTGDQGPGKSKAELRRRRPIHVALPRDVLRVPGPRSPVPASSPLASAPHFRLKCRASPHSGPPMLRIQAEALTYDDVSLVPAHSIVLPKDVSLETRL